MTLGAFLELDRDAIRQQVKLSTLIVHEGVSKHAKTAIGAGRDLASIDWSDVATLKNWLGAEHVLDDRTLPPCSKATIRRSVVTLKAAFNRAIKRGLIDDNPFVGERLAKVQPKQKRIYSHEEVDVMVEASPGIWWQSFIRLAFTSGLRSGELLNLTWEDIDEAEGQVVVSAKRPRQFVAGGNSYPVLAFSCKSHRERRVPLHPDAAALLKRLRVKSGGSIYSFISLQRLAILGATEDTTQEIPAAKLVNNMLRAFGAIQVRARAILAKRRDVKLDDVDWRLGNLHDFRKSYGTHMAKHVSMPELQRLMGHASITTTSEFYVDLSDDVADKVQAAFAG